ncbi:MAG: DUF2905 domain-containing protein [Fimbriimonadales bacterium]|nr:DUF2905 domain-containing protein [Fimbriimonadales bacterium]
MPELAFLARLLIFVGVGFLVLGVLLLVLQHFPGLRVGRLPGDIYIQRDGFTFYFPIVTMLIISAILSFILWVIAFLRR